jgi:DNA-binding LacI/PurR family transcriptional regulator
VPTALFSGNSIMALGVYRAFRELDVTIPDDVAVVAFDYLQFTDTLEPPLTTMESVEEKIGESSARILLEKIRSKDTETVEELLIKSQICLRRSCGCGGEQDRRETRPSKSGEQT